MRRDHLRAIYAGKGGTEGATPENSQVKVLSDVSTLESGTAICPPKGKTAVDACPKLRNAEVYQGCLLYTSDAADE